MKISRIFAAIFSLACALNVIAQGAWIQQTSGTSYNLVAVFFVNADTGWAVGDYGTILKTTNGGTTWTTQISGTPNSLTAIHFLNANVGYAVGSGGTVFKTTNGGNNWILLPASGYGMTSVQFIDANTGYSSAYSNILKTTDGGVTWSSVYYVYNSNRWLNRVYFTDANTGYAIGDLGTISKTTDAGLTWTEQASAFYSSNGGILKSASFPNQSTGYVVGGGGGILKTTNGGTDWVSQTAGTTNPLWSVHFTDANTGWAVGEGATILNTTNGGLTWGSQASNFQTPGRGQLYGVYFVGANNGYIVGADGIILKYILAPAVPVLTIPAQNATGVPTFVTLNWSVSGGATSYRVQLSTDSTFTTTLYDDSTLTTNSVYMETALVNNTVYYWRVNAKNGGGTSVFSTTGRFTTVIGFPSIPVLISPSNNVANLPLSDTLVWTASTNAATYRVQLSTDSTFATTLVNDSALTTTTRAVGPLVNGTAYYWRVNAKNVGGTSQFSSRQKFVTVANTFPFVATATTYWDTTSNFTQKCPMEFGNQTRLADWNDIVAFIQQGGSITDFVNRVGMGVAYGNDASIANDPWVSYGGAQFNSGNRRYFIERHDHNVPSGWLVHSTINGNSVDLGSWYGMNLRILCYRPIVVPILNTPAIRSNDFILQRVNLVNGNTLQFNVPQRAHVVINLFDSQGRIVTQLLNETRDAGSYTLPLPVGLRGSYYLLDFRAGDVHKTMKVQP